MKNYFKALLILLAIFGSGCQKENPQKCVKGRVIGFQSCYNVSIIQILSGSKIGGTVVWDGKKYENVVQFPGGAISDSIIYFHFRSFDAEKDKDPGNPICPANIAPLILPKIMITDFSNSNCP